MQPIPLTQPLPTDPITHPDSCLSLSQPLLNLLCSLPRTPKRTILSIGAGTGLLESLLAANAPATSDVPALTAHGIEPHPGLANRYLAPESLHLVPGTWAVLPMSLAASHGMWLFVYPRESGLVGRYLDGLVAAEGEHGDGAGDATVAPGGGDFPLVVVWAGARVDWEDGGFAAEFRRHGETLVLRDCLGGDEAGLKDWEMVAVFDRKKKKKTRVG